jgi:ADP-ribose pyrophosphatase
MIRKLTSKTVYKNNWMLVREDTVEFESKKQGIYGVVEKADFAMIVPLTDTGFILVNQFRYPVQQSFWEFPQGSYEKSADIDPLELAKNELKEETGYTAGSLIEIGFLYEAYGYCNQGFHIFLAKDLQAGSTQLEDSEAGMTHKEVKFKEFSEMVANGKIKDAPTLSAYALLKLKNIL